MLALEVGTRAELLHVQGVFECRARTDAIHVKAMREHIKEFVPIQLNPAKSCGMPGELLAVHEQNS